MIQNYMIVCIIRDFRNQYFNQNYFFSFLIHYFLHTISISDFKKNQAIYYQIQYFIISLILYFQGRIYLHPNHFQGLLICHNIIFLKELYFSFAFYVISQFKYNFLELLIYIYFLLCYFYFFFFIIIKKNKRNMFFFFF